MPWGPGQVSVGSACVPYRACAAGVTCGSFTSRPGQVTRRFLATRYFQPVWCTRHPDRLTGLNGRKPGGRDTPEDTK
jgi:hypothetical protein